jgi:hypothetical protein
MRTILKLLAAAIALSAGAAWFAVLMSHGVRAQTYGQVLWGQQQGTTTPAVVIFDGQQYVTIGTLNTVTHTFLLNTFSGATFNANVTVTGRVITTGAGNGFTLSPVAAGNGQLSGTLVFNSTTSGGTSAFGTVFEDTSGNMEIQDSNGVTELTVTTSGLTLGGRLTTPGVTSTASVSSPATIATGSPPTMTGTCAANGQFGGNTAGWFTANGTCTAGTYILTFATTAPGGWTCMAVDRNTGAYPLGQILQSTTMATLKAVSTVTTGDIVLFMCTAW